MQTFTNSKILEENIILHNISSVFAEIPLINFSVSVKRNFTSEFRSTFIYSWGKYIDQSRFTGTWSSHNIMRHAGQGIARNIFQNVLFVHRIIKIFELQYNWWIVTVACFLNVTLYYRSIRQNFFIDIFPYSVFTYIIFLRLH